MSTLIGTSANDTLVGDNAGDTIDGMGGNDVLIGGSGDDVFDIDILPSIIGAASGIDIMEGGDGNDIYIVDNSQDQVVETDSSPAGGFDTVFSSVNYALSANVEELILVTTGSAKVGTGNSGDNTIIGNNGGDTLDGGGSNAGDFLQGGTGNDTYIVHNTNDVINETDGTITDIDTVIAKSSGTFTSYDLTSDTNVENLIIQGTANFAGTGNSNNNTIIGSTGNDTLDGGSAGNDNLQGGAGSDTLTVAGGNCVLDGGTGADTMNAGNGTDTFFVDNVGDTINIGTGTYTVESSISYSLQTGIDNLVLTGSSAISGTANNDAAGDHITGNSANNLLTGGTGGDVLDGGAGADTMIGGAGNDIYFVDNLNDKVIESTAGVGGGTDMVISSISYALGTNVENLTLSGIGNINGTGNALDNAIIGNAGNNIIDGGVGADTMKGGGGNDTYFVDNVGDIVDEIPGQGIDTVVTTVNNYSLTSAANVENLVLSGSATVGSGDGNSNVITANNLGDTLSDGGGAADTFIGGSGNDTYFVNNSNDVIQDLSGGTADTAVATVSFTLPAGVENLFLTGGSDITGTGTSGVNVINADGNGGSILAATGNDTLDGGGGADTLIGGTGTNTYIVYTGTETITAHGTLNTVESSTISLNLTLPKYTGIQNITLLGNANLNATGDGNVNTITGNAGNDVLDGGGGADTLIGGTGNDIFIIHNGSSETLIAGSGTNTVEASDENIDLNNYVGIQNATLIGTAAHNITGDANNNVITGNAAGGEVLNGGAGNDTISDGGVNTSGNPITMIGGTGDDTFLVNNANDVIQENPGEGNDTVIVAAGITNFSTPSNVEVVIHLGSSNGSLTGGPGNDTLTGTDGNNVIDGGAGADTMIGLKGNDTYLVDNAGDVIIEQPGQGVDKLIITSSPGFNFFDMSASANNVESATVVGSTGFELIGTTGDNVLVTGSGNDVLVDNGGLDTLNGGLGNDTYVVSNFNDKIIDAGGDDTIEIINHYTLQGNIENLIVFNPVSIETEFYAKGNSLNNIIDGSHLTHDYTLMGLGGNDTIIGGAGNDSLDGGTGADTMAGGAGNDTYFVDNPNDFIIENTGQGTDVLTTKINYVLNPTAEVEDISLTGGTGQSFTASDTANVITADASSKYIYGMGGNDTITGSPTTDVINGGAGDDTITGNGGADRLTGGAGQDTFVFQLATAFVHAVTITDFNPTDTGNLGSGTPQGDVLDLSDILDNVTGTGHIEPLTDFLRLVNSGNNTLVQVDLDGAGTLHHFQTIAVLDNVTGLGAIELWATGNINIGTFGG